MPIKNADQLPTIKMSVSELKELIEHIVKYNSTAKPIDQFSLIIKGPPGVGKTGIIEQVAQKLFGTTDRLYKSHPAVDEPTDIKGFIWPNEDKRSADFIPTGVMSKLFQETLPAIWLADDFGQAPQSVQVGYMQYLYGKELNGKKLGDNITIILATNRKEDMAAVYPIPEPVKSRTIIVELEFILEEWVKWALENNMPYELIAFARFRSTLFDEYKPTNDMVNQVTPRNMARVGNLLNSNLPQHLRRATFAGTIGQGPAIEFTSFLDVVSKLPDPEYILANPDTAEVPSEISTKHALVSAIGKHVKEPTVANAFRYLERWNEKAYDFLFVKDLQTLKLTNNDAFKKFCVKNHTLIS